MGETYLQIRNDNLKEAWARSPEELARSLPAELKADGLHFRAFGEDCLLARKDITLAGQPATGPEGILIAMYANSVQDLPAQMEPLKSFKDLPDSMPYHGAFAVNAECILIPHVEKIRDRQAAITARFSGKINAGAISGDFSFTLYPLPRVPLYYIFNLPDEEFPASVTCLFAANATAFLPVAGLADVAEYTARRLIAMANAA